MSVYIVRIHRRGDKSAPGFFGVVEDVEKSFEHKFKSLDELLGILFRLNAESLEGGGERGEGR